MRGLHDLAGPGPPTADLSAGAGYSLLIQIVLPTELPAIIPNMGLPSERLEQYRTQIDTIAGVLQRLDSYLFEAIDSAQDRHGITGDLLEIGVYQGRSAIVLGFLRKNSEQLHLCGPFEAPAVDSPNFLSDTLDWYNDYNQDLVEANYLRFHNQLPHIHA